MTSGLETEWDYSGRKGRDGQKEKISKANERKRKVNRGKRWGSKWTREKRAAPAPHGVQSALTYKRLNTGAVIPDCTAGGVLVFTGASLTGVRQTLHSAAFWAFSSDIFSFATASLSCQHHTTAVSTTDLYIYNLDTAPPTDVVWNDVKWCSHPSLPPKMATSSGQERE